MKRKLIVLAVIFFVITAACWVWPDAEMSDAERRKLQQMPQLSLENVMNGSFMSDFESYTLDQFPLRDQLRSLKALAEYNLFQKKDNNDLYEADGYVAKILYPYNAGSVSNAAKKFGEIYENFLKGNCENIYASVIPDKSYYMAYENGYPNLDHNPLVSSLFSAMSYAKMIPLSDYMELDDFYNKLIAERIAEKKQAQLQNTPYKKMDMLEVLLSYESNDKEHGLEKFSRSIVKGMLSVSK